MSFTAHHRKCRANCRHFGIIVCVTSVMFRNSNTWRCDLEAPRGYQQRHSDSQFANRYGARFAGVSQIGFVESENELGFPS